MAWKIVDLEDTQAELFRRQFAAMGCEHVRAVSAYRKPVLARCLVSREPWPYLPDGTFAERAQEWRWHISISIREPQERPPTWNEMAALVHLLRPGIPFVMGIPPRSQWMNVHEHTLHAFETTDAPLLASWRDNARGDTPT